MQQLYINIKNRRKELKLTQTDLANKLGYADRSMIAKIEKGQVDISQSKIIEFAKALNTTVNELTGWSESDTTTQKPNSVRIPVLADVACGVPTEAIELWDDSIDYEEITEALARTGDYFGLRLKGDSMSPRFCDGDIVIVRLQPDAETGEIVIAKVNGDDACCKRLIKYSEGLSLVSLNPAYEPMTFSDLEVKEIPVSIIGKVVELRAKI